MKFPCPQCDCIIEQDSSDIIPTPNRTEEHASDSENCNFMNVECTECEKQFTIEVYMNIYEGNVRLIRPEKRHAKYKIFMYFTNNYVKERLSVLCFFVRMMYCCLIPCVSLILHACDCSERSGDKHVYNPTTWSSLIQEPINRF